jgi:hypothetical protein
MPIDKRADVSETASESSIEVDEGDAKSLRQESTYRALADATRADQLNHGATLTDQRLLFLQREERLKFFRPLKGSYFFGCWARAVDGGTCPLRRMYTTMLP